MGRVSWYKIQVDGVTYRVSVEDESGEVTGVAEVQAPRQEAPAPKEQGEPRARVAVSSLLPGNVYDVLCQAGDEVKQGDSLLVLEAMKMQSPVYAPQDGVVDSVEVKAGDVVRAGQALVYLV